MPSSKLTGTFTQVVFSPKGGVEGLLVEVAHKCRLLTPVSVDLHHAPQKISSMQKRVRMHAPRRLAAAIPVAAPCPARKSSSRAAARSDAPLLWIMRALKRRNRRTLASRSGERPWGSCRGRNVLRRRTKHSG